MFELRFRVVMPALEERKPFAIDELEEFVRPLAVVLIDPCFIKTGVRTRPFIRKHLPVKPVFLLASDGPFN
jgi:hypothetical protein